MRRTVLVIGTAVVAVLLASALVIAQQQRPLDMTSGVLNTAIEPQSHEFSDVPTGSPFHPFVSWLVARGITGGCAPGLFCPDAPVTRAQMAVFLKANSLRGSPLAFGTIAANGTIASGSGNFTSTFNETDYWYEITITNHPYFFPSYTTTVTPAGVSDCWGLSPVVDHSPSGKLIVQLTDTAYVYSCAFSFVTYYNGN